MISATIYFITVPSSYILLSLENSNCAYIDELIDLLRNNVLSDEIKRMILLIAMEQEL